ncbi:hypothetical protein PCL1606_28200 [Pseudomonas chlororaphis]|uniref:Uncharacterized protein n=1 Tax=Pseudomonas chlororaphis TaxID=587753 RepID=A0A0D5XYY3_9PSED|nr:hypothetical protein PCL1606_28200 [Pseudomonas chlororaphis]
MHRVLIAFARWRLRRQPGNKHARVPLKCLKQQHQHCFRGPAPCLSTTDSPAT